MLHRSEQKRKYSPKANVQRDLQTVYDTLACIK
jgi:hypothetical protein